MSRSPVPPRGKKAKLSDVLPDLLNASFGSVSQGARRAGVEPRSLLNCLNQNRFYEEDLHQLLPLLEVDSSWLDQHEFGVIPEAARRKTRDVPMPAASGEQLNPHLRSLCIQTRMALQLIGSKAVVADLFRRFAQENCRCAMLLFVMGDEEIIEWTHPTSEVLTSVLDSLARGLEIVYLLPHRGGQTAKSSGYNLPPLTRRPAEQIRRQLEEFKVRLTCTLRATPSFEGRGLTPEHVSSRVDLQFFDEPFHPLLPAFKHALMCYHLGDAARYCRFANINVTVHREAQSAGEFGAILPLAEADAERLVKLCKSICESAPKGQVAPLFRRIVQSLLW